METSAGDCQNLPNSTKVFEAEDGKSVIWKLTARKRDPITNKTYEIWQDTRTQKLWGDTLDSSYNLKDATAFHGPARIPGEKVCEGEEGKRALAGGVGKTFRLPTIQEWEQANRDGATHVLPNMERIFWTSSIDNRYTGFGAPAKGQYFDGMYGYDGVDRLDNENAVRCIGR